MSFPTSLNLKGMLLGTPFEPAAKKLRWLLASRRRQRHPELWEIYLEDQRVDEILRRTLANDVCR